jgi:nucleoside-diphosphate-sugar epimerase
MRTYGTGLSGFLGLHLASRLDNFVAIPHDEIQTTKLEPYSRFFFCSTYGNISFHQEDYKIIQANVLDLIHVLSGTDWTDGIESFVFVSTSSVARKIQTMYSRIKKAAEEILLAYMEKYNAPICIVRPFSITGIGEQREHLIPTLIRSCLKGESMPFVPDATHDFIDVSDVVEGILTLSGRHAKGIFELGTGRSYTNREVKAIVEKITGKKANTHIVSNMRAYDSDLWVSTNMRARTYGWEPRKSLEQSIKEMYEHLGETDN